MSSNLNNILLNADLHAVESFIAPKNFKIIWVFQSFDFETDNTRNVSHTLNSMVKITKPNNSTKVSRS